MHVYPAILSDALQLVSDQITEAQQLPGVTTVHVDVIDGIFADNLTVAPVDIVDLSFGELTADFHLMVEEPVDYVLELVPHKQTLPIRALVGQIERMSSQKFFVEEVKKQGWKAGLALDLFTPAEEIDDASWDYLDCVIVLAVEAGLQGQQFHAQALEKIAEIRQQAKRRQKEIEIIVDGGVDETVLKRIYAAGADSVAIGSHLWHADDPDSLVAQAHMSLERYTE
ncbi:hypothetical protein KA078_01120 [Candidatus Woesebacteria bacterium]|nr:hypothetical protein [Candidatus Woesebacteria bacterium]